MVLNYDGHSKTCCEKSRLYGSNKSKNKETIVVIVVIITTMELRVRRRVIAIEKVKAIITKLQ